MTAGHGLDENTPTRTVENVPSVAGAGGRGRCTAIGEAGATMTDRTARRGTPAKEEALSSRSSYDSALAKSHPLLGLSRLWHMWQDALQTKRQPQSASRVLRAAESCYPGPRRRTPPASKAATDFLQVPPSSLHVPRVGDCVLWLPPILFSALAPPPLGRLVVRVALAESLRPHQSSIPPPQARTASPPDEDDEDDRDGTIVWDGLCVAYIRIRLLHIQQGGSRQNAQAPLLQWRFSAQLDGAPLPLLGLVYDAVHEWRAGRLKVVGAWRVSVVDCVQKRDVDVQNENLD
ncbi:hypothetical protein BJV78DRAFT_1154607 [Lactifluus subvellereus]|nr:hypothetical protein BJV78DRAFT_1154607 [Lactifluus subvellereus]